MYTTRKEAFHYGKRKGTNPPCLDDVNVKSFASAENTVDFSSVAKFVIPGWR